MKKIRSSLEMLIAFAVLATMLIACTEESSWQLSSPDGKLIVTIENIEPESSLNMVVLLHGQQLPNNQIIAAWKRIVML